MLKNKFSLPLFLCLALFIPLLISTPARATAGDTIRVSVSSDGAQGAYASWYPSISADGRYVSFASQSTNLVHGDNNAVVDIFVRDLFTHTTTRVSVNSSGEQGYNAYQYFSTVSPDGRYVAFGSANLMPGESDDKGGLYIRDTIANTTTFLNVNDFYMSNLTFSLNGRYLAYSSYNTYIVAEDTNGATDVFVRDMIANTTTRVSISSSGEQANSWSQFFSISSDGRYVTFKSNASNLVVDDTNNAEDIFEHDTVTHTTTRVSGSSGGALDVFYISYPRASADGRYFLFTSDLNTLVAGDINGRWDAFVYDRSTEEKTRLAVETNAAHLAPSNGLHKYYNTFGTSISADGRYVTFLSDASDLVEGDTNGVQDVFVFDRKIGLVSRVSVDSNGREGNQISDSPSISADGRYVVFRSMASNLVAGDTNGQWDIFVHKLDTIPPSVSFGPGTVPNYRQFITVRPSTLSVKFTEAVLGNGTKHAANSLSNYLLVSPGPNQAFDTAYNSTVACGNQHLPDGDDVAIDLESVKYTAYNFTALIRIKPAYAPLAYGQYRLIVCGVDSIWDINGNPLNGGINTAITINVTEPGTATLTPDYGLRP